MVDTPPGRHGLHAHSRAVAGQGHVPGVAPIPALHMAGVRAAEQAPRHRLVTLTTVPVSQCHRRIEYVYFFFF